MYILNSFDIELLLYPFFIIIFFSKKISFIYISLEKYSISQLNETGHPPKK